MYAIVFILLLLTDRYSKNKIKKMPLYKTREIVKDKLYLRHVKNKGAFLGKGSKYPKTVTAATAAVLFSLLFYVLNTRDLSRFSRLALTVVMAGGCGNLLDRLFDGEVTDFIMVKKEKTPIFNFADIFIFFGCLLYGIGSLVDIILNLLKR